MLFREEKEVCVCVCVGGASQVLAVKNPPAHAGDVRDAGSIPGSGRSPGEGNGQLTPILLPGKYHGQRIDSQRVGHN